MIIIFTLYILEPLLGKCFASIWILLRMFILHEYYVFCIKESGLKIDFEACISILCFDDYHNKLVSIQCDVECFVNVLTVMDEDVYFQSCQLMFTRKAHITFPNHIPSQNACFHKIINILLFPNITSICFLNWNIKY